MKKIKTKVGKVVSNRMTKSAVVLVETATRHPLYEKMIKRRKKFMVHDENNEAKIGDIVRIQETKPISARKTWRIVSFVERSIGEE